MQKSHINKEQLFVNWILIVGVVLGPFFLFCQMCDNVFFACVLGVSFAVPLLFIVCAYLPNPDLNRQREQKIHESKLDISATWEQLRNETAKLIDLEDKFNDGQVHLQREIQKQKEVIKFWQDCLDSCQRKLDQLEEEEEKWKEESEKWKKIQNRACERLKKTTEAPPTEHSQCAISKK